ncbi:MAG: helix-turn-helix transcriptional regulator [Streptococcus sp.]|nr:helix-turn-helix transcriptional regulator [Streptococcus sp.]
MTIGTRLQTLRKERHLTQANVAKALGISQQSYGRWETDKVKPSPDKLTQIATYFGVSTDYLLNSDTDDIDLSEVELLFRTTSKGMTEEERATFKQELIEFMRERKKLFENSNQ